MRKNDFDIVNTAFLYNMDEHAAFCFENEPRGFFWHPIYKHWIIFSMDKLKEASKMNDVFSLAKTSPKPLVPPAISTRCCSQHVATGSLLVEGSKQIYLSNGVFLQW